MIAERLLSAVMTRENDRLLTLTPTDLIRLPEPDQSKTYMLYAHVPFCERLCPYCSFNRFPYDRTRAEHYFKHLRTEMKLVADRGYNFASLYIGGGTPTVHIDELVATIDLAKQLFDIQEVSCETNPNHLTEKWIGPLTDRVDRMSVGVQSFDDGLLAQMDRYDKYGSGESILESIQDIKGAFGNLNVDMIFNFPSQTEQMLRTDCDLVIESGCDQTTFYPLMASPVVEAQLAATVGRVSYEREAQYYQLICQELASAFEPATAWAFSRASDQMIDEYIIDYEEYIGIGSGAMSFVDSKLLVNTFSLAEYCERIAVGKTGVTHLHQFDIRDLMRYRFLMGFFGLSLDRAQFKEDFGVRIEAGLPVEMTYMRAVGAFDRYDADLITLSPKGRYLLVAMMRQFFIGVNNIRDEARAALDSDEKRILFGDGCEDRM
ncbi:MAG: coproporphyrinogen III oxidase family protein [Coriobacteriia bacterium]|nr:coproporphyrinogen III oxidase family protein [Coriobacteriia bacterium]